MRIQNSSFWFPPPPFFPPPSPSPSYENENIEIIRGFRYPILSMFGVKITPPFSFPYLLIAPHRSRPLPFLCKDIRKRRIENSAASSYLVPPPPPSRKGECPMTSSSQLCKIRMKRVCVIKPPSHERKWIRSVSVAPHSSSSRAGASLSFFPPFPHPPPLQMRGLKFAKKPLQLINFWKTKGGVWRLVMVFPSVPLPSSFLSFS